MWRVGNQTWAIMNVVVRSVSEPEDFGNYCVQSVELEDIGGKTYHRESWSIEPLPKVMEGNWYMFKISEFKCYLLGE